MDYYCEVCDMFKKSKSKSRRFISNTHKIIDKHKHIKLTIDNDNIDNIGKIFYTYIIGYDDKYKNYLVRREFKLVFSNNEGCPLAWSKLTDNKTKVSWKIIVKTIIKKFENEGIDFSHLSHYVIIVIYHIIIVAKKMDMTHDFYVKHNMQMVELQLNK